MCRSKSKQGDEVSQAVDPVFDKVALLQSFRYFTCAEKVMVVVSTSFEQYLTVTDVIYIRDKIHACSRRTNPLDSN